MINKDARLLKNHLPTQPNVQIVENQIPDVKMLKFKTGGMRGIMKDGFDGINEVTCNMLGTVLVNKFSNIVIGFDHRILSDRFAFIIFSMFQLNNKQVKLFKHCTTPYLAWESLQYDVGLMITASHNSKEYNGFKVYKDGSQIVNPLDTEIENELKTIPFTDISTQLSDSKWEDKLMKSCSKINYELFFDSYKLAKVLTKKQTVPVFSALHGVSSSFLCQAIKYFNIQINMDSIQNEVDGQFPGIPHPNPEINQPWELLTKEVMENASNTFYFMCDPDGDRFGLAEVAYNVNEESNHIFKQYNGNEIAKIMFWYFLKKYPVSEIALVSTFLCDDFFSLVSKELGIQYVQTQTGFKHVSKAVKDLRKTNQKLKILAYEDTLGYLTGDSTERDGVKTAVIIHSILQEITPRQIIQSFERFGTFNSYTCHIRMDRPKDVLDEILKTEQFEGIYDGYVKYEKDFKIILRLSGTEPMLKIYSFTTKIHEECLKECVNDWVNQNVNIYLNK